MLSLYCSRQSVKAGNLILPRRNGPTKGTPVAACSARRKSSASAVLGPRQSEAPRRSVSLTNLTKPRVVRVMELAPDGPRLHASGPAGQGAQLMEKLPNQDIISQSLNQDYSGQMRPRARTTSSHRSHGCPGHPSIPSDAQCAVRLVSLNHEAGRA